MEIKLYSNDRIKIDSSYNLNIYIDIERINYESMGIDLYPNFYIIELREKDKCLKLFLYKDESYKKEADLGWWKDAKVIYTINSNSKKKRRKLCI